MSNQLLNISSFPRAILHIDGDAFFASCEQSRNPKLEGRPVITGKERGIAASLSYEAKAKGIERGMGLFEIKKLCPEAVILPSDYETYSLLSKRFFEVVRRYTPEVEKYSIDECFADVTGLRRPRRMNYFQIASEIKRNLDNELGFTFSVGLAPNKVIAKIASKWKKPSGLTAIPGKHIHFYLEQLPVEKIWGIGHQTAAYLHKERITTALQFARKDENWVKKRLTKPFLEIWQELNGKYVLKLETQEKESYASIQKMKTFTPPSNNKEFVFAQLSKNIENACIKSRKYKLAAKEVVFFLRTQDFNHLGVKIKLSHATACPNEIIKSLRKIFPKIYQPSLHYRATGIVLLNLKEDSAVQISLFENPLDIEKMEKIYHAVDGIREKYGKHTLYLGSSFLAHQFAQHEGERGRLPQRKTDLFKGETARKRLSIPMFIGKVT